MRVSKTHGWRLVATLNATLAEGVEWTEREQVVLRELARGRSNLEIASGLFVSVETVKSHVASILMKLGVRDRTQAVIVAYESGFVQPGSAQDL